MKKTALLLIALTVLAAGCIDNTPNPTTTTTTPQQEASTTTSVISIQSSSTTTTLITSNPTTTVPSTQAASLVEANNRFAINLYKEILKNDGGNIFFSPWSIETALSMTYEGARGKTASEMQKVLGIPSDDAARRNSFKQIQDQINAGSKDYRLSTANAIWPQNNYPFLPEYTSIIQNSYGGESRPMDYVSNAEGSRQIINSWVENKTNDKIKDLIPQGALTPMTRLVLTNAIYFKGKWVLQFNETNTKQEDFKVNATAKVKAPLMKKTGEKAKFKYAEISGTQILELPYEGKEISMLILLPKEGDMPAFEKEISAEKISEWRNSIYERRVDVYLPKFKVETKYFLPQQLSSMGMPTAFTSNADFSGMDGTRNLSITDVIHQAYVEVNEEGTEAAAATAVIVGLTSAMPAPTPIFRADRPFIYIIQQTDTGNILFIGKINNPTQNAA
ncbi:Serpin (serine protease inhibitor) [uncultured archaeon]|nr:Serpin (serine protease inhibitor) [uncultured archaeon]